MAADEQGDVVGRLAAFVSDFIAQLSSHKTGSLAQVRAGRLAAPTNAAWVA